MVVFLFCFVCFVFFGFVFVFVCLLVVLFCFVSFLLKDLMPITFPSPRAQPGVVYFLTSNESPYFSYCKSKISASNSLHFWRYNKKCEVKWYTRK